MLTRQRKDNGQTILITCLILFGIGIRFYKLGTPSLWYDEMLTTTIVDYPFSYFFNWVTKLEVHPIYQYILVYLSAKISHSDAMLRLIPAIFGSMTLFAFWKLGALIQEQYRVGKQFTAFVVVLAVFNPFLIYYSRVARPYSVMLLFSIVAIIYLIKYIATRDHRFLIYHSAAMCLCLMMHYEVIFFAASCYIFFVIERLRSKVFPINKSLLLLLLYYVIAFIPTAFFFYKTLLFRGDLTFKAPIIQYTTLAFKQLPELYDFYVGYYGGIAILLGLVAYACFRKSTLSNLFLVLQFVPVVFICILRHGYYPGSRLYAFALPVQMVILALLASDIKHYKKMPALTYPVALSAVLLGLFAANADLFYNMNSYGGWYKQVASVVSGYDPSTSFTVLDPQEMHAASWYINQHSSLNPLIETSLSPDESYKDLKFVTTADGTLGHLYVPTNNLFMLDQKPISVQNFIHPFYNPLNRGEATVHAISTFRVERKPQHQISSLPFTYDFHADPFEFIQNTYMANGVQYYPYWFKYITPSLNMKESQISFRFNNNTGPGPVVVAINTDYRSIGKGSYVKGELVYGNSLPLEIFNTPGGAPDTTGNGSVNSNDVMVVPVCAKDIVLNYKMLTSYNVPGYNGGNLDNVGLGRFKIVVFRYNSDLMDIANTCPGIKFSNIHGVEHSDKFKWRWITGYNSSFSFSSTQKTTAVLAYSLHNPFPDQSYSVFVNSKKILEAELPHQSGWLKTSASDSMVIPIEAGLNVVTFNFTVLNCSPDCFLANDKTPYAAAFTDLKLILPSGNQVAPENGTTEPAGF
jgi:hypothetical protein